jgi:outer membrane protein assembly factor BamE (lipoprotein component of BamABCDE complex)
MVKKKILIFLSLIFLISCQQSNVIKTHGIAYLDKREKLITLNKTNKNDVISFLGKPATKGMTNDNLWIYIERTKSRGKILKLGKNYLTKNNVLVVEFNKYGIVSNKKFYDINNMKNLEFAQTITENEVKKENFIYSFLSSIRQKMETSKK